MSPRATRLFKEGRTLFWPWCAVTSAGAVPMLLLAFSNHGVNLWPGFNPRHGAALDVSLAGFVLGIPLLATLPFGSEFQHRTVSVLLSQPVNRMAIWAEKLAVTIVAALSAG